MIAATGRPHVPPEPRGQPVHHPPLVHGDAETWISCRARRTALGQHAECDVVLADPSVAPRHALIEHDDGEFRLYAGDHRLPTRVNGHQAMPGLSLRLTDHDWVQIGAYTFRFRQGSLHWLRPVALTLAASHVHCKATGDRGPVTLVDRVSLVCRPGEFVGLLGPSGAGKSTLLGALSGLRAADGGEVLLNGESLYEHYPIYRQTIGYVPQEDIVHAELTCRQALHYAGRLRLPEMADDELGRRVEETLGLLELLDRADLRVAQLSGGQRKRINLGVELLTRPEILFLDEPTAGLDPGTEGRLMRLFRELARQGRVVVCATHIMEQVQLFDKVAVLAPGGRLAWFGEVEAGRKHFQVERFSDLYERLEEQPPEQWQRDFQKTAADASIRTALAAERVHRPFHAQTRPAPAAQPGLLEQTSVLASRFVRTLGADARILRPLVLQPLAITAMICVVFQQLPTLSFLLVLSAMWFGCGLAAQQIVKERAIYRRERRVNLRRDAYIFSKFLPLALISALQTALMLAVVAAWKEPDWNWPLQAIAVVLAGWNGVGLGLLVSALAVNPDRASAMVPTALLPQIVLAGVLVALPDLHPAPRFASYGIAARWANQATEVALLEGRTIDNDLLQKQEFLCPLWNMYPDYKLLTPAGQRTFLEDHQDERVERMAQAQFAFVALGLLLTAELAGVGWLLGRRN